MKRALILNNPGQPAGFRPVVDCDIRAAGWRAHLPRARSHAAKAIAKALAAAGVNISATGDRLLEISLVLADDAFVRELNRNYRGQDKPTNVLSFPALDADEVEQLWAAGEIDATLPEELPLGDIILALETVEREAAAAGKSVKEYFYHLVVHGLLHLIGYDHINDLEAAEMEQLETAILASFGLADPYSLKE